MEELIDNCLETADRHNTKAIAFPTLGVGSLLYPVEESAQLMGECIRYFCTNHSGDNIKTIIIVVYRGSSNYADVFEVDIRKKSFKQHTIVLEYVLIILINANCILRSLKKNCQEDHWLPLDPINFRVLRLFLYLLVSNNLVILI